MSHFFMPRHLPRKLSLVSLALVNLIGAELCWAAGGCTTNQLGHCLKQTYLLRRGNYGTALTIKTKELSAQNRKAAQAKAFARISDSRLEKLPNGDGMWHAKVSGLGRVMLRLEIRNGTKLQQTHLIGQIDLAQQKDPVAFSFRRSLPENPQWSWKIVAHPTT